MACMKFSFVSSPSRSWTASSAGVSRNASSLLINRCSSASSRTCMCMPLSKSTPFTATTAPSVQGYDALLKYLRPPVMLPPEVDDSARLMELLEGTQRALQRSSEPRGTMMLIDTLQRLGIAYHFEEDIAALLEQFSDENLGDEDLFTTALCFRLLRHNGHQISTDVFRKFMDKNMEFKESLSEDTVGLLSLYEASYLGANGEDVLSQAVEFSEIHLKKAIPVMAPQLRRQVLQSFELPRHLRMARLEARRYIEEYSNESDHSSALLELAMLDFNKVQALHQMELAEISRWWKHLGLVDKLSFARDRPLECFLWTVGLLPEPKYSGCRIELAKNIAILLVIDDIFDTHGSFSDLVLFTDAIRRWDLNAMEQLPEYMKICYMALYNTTNEVSYKVLKEHGWSVRSYLQKTWIDMIEGFMLEAEWLNNGHIPNLEDYIENGVTTAGTYMALVHVFFLIGKGVTDENVKLLVKPYPKLFSSSGRILRLWDDLGTAKEEQERGDVASSIQLFMKENDIKSEDEARKQIIQLIQGLWKELNGELIAPNALPLPIIKTAFNMSRTSQVVYQHDEDSYFSSVDNYVQSLFFTPVEL
ncbi:hypothetical protein RJ640_011236 [Escallonia rubra]|uniref:Geraniol synthase n=1 Tax=Escallonia rubra TaxID=112253 RepID=A0AA88UNS8_9ASTE|nr:hypothetical protein RJ640_011236 [Escallonia rubra]